MSIITVENVTKEYKLGQMKSLKHTVLNTLSRLGGKTVDRQQPFKALNDVSFSVEPGEVIGIIGTNGAGKSTLLKMLARISTPTRGNVKVNGTVAPLIEVGAGLIGDLTGRENIYVNGSIMGLSRDSIREKFDEIVAFAELEEFIDTPIKRYSSGMQVRLGFSIATTVAADILIVDEVLAVGDLAFQRKCFDRMEELIRRQGRTVLLVSHNIRQVERICTRTLLMEHGKILADGAPADICNLFYERSDAKIKNTSARGCRHESTGEVELLDIYLMDESGTVTDNIGYRNDVTVVIIYKSKTELTKPVFGIGVHTTDFLFLATNVTEQQFHDRTIEPGIHRVECKVREFPFLPGVYSLRLGLSVGEMVRPVFYAENIHNFQVRAVNEKRSQSMQEGFVEIDAVWEMNSVAEREELTSDRVHQLTV